MKLYLGRQPILDLKQKTVGYELLYRSGGERNVFDGTDPTLATSQVLYNLFLGFAPKEITGGKRAFINFNRELLTSEVLGLLDPMEVVIELLEGEKVDDELIRQCALLRKAGFSLALDDVDLMDHSDLLFPLASIVKVDWRKTSSSEMNRILELASKHNCTLLAEKVETAEEFQRALQLGFRYFQGYFFAKPVILEKREIPMAHWSWLKVFSVLQRPELDFREVADIVRKDPTLSYKLLRIVNSAYLGLKERVSSVQQAVVLLGEREIRRWLSLLLLARISEKKPAELMITACVRGRLAERVAEQVGQGALAPSAFLMGVLSLLDAIMGRPLEELLADLPLDPAIPRALLEGKGPLAPFYFLVRGYEYGNDKIITKCSQRLKIAPKDLARCYIDAIQWTDQLYPQAAA